MANHAGFSIASQTQKDFLKYNSAVASMFFTSLEAAAYSIPGPAIPVPLSGSNLTDHPIISGNPGWPIYSPGGNSRISTVVTRSFCGVYQNYFSDAIATLADLDNVINTQTDQAVTEGVVWALALEKSQVTGPGRVVICGDSGWLGSENSAARTPRVRDPASLRSRTIPSSPSTPWRGLAAWREFGPTARRSMSQSELLKRVVETPEHSGILCTDDHRS